MATPQPATNGLTLDQVAEFLLRNQYLLTSLELHQESIERGQELGRLKSLFTATKLDEVAANEDAAAWNAASASLRPGRPGKPGSNGTPAQSSTELSNRISLLEYELRQERQTTQELRLELSKLFSSKDALPPNQQTDASAYKKQKPASSIETRILNYLVKKYLVSQGYKLTAISLSSEVRNFGPISRLLSSLLPTWLFRKHLHNVCSHFFWFLSPLTPITDQNVRLCVCL